MYVYIYIYIWILDVDNKPCRFDLWRTKCASMCSIGSRTVADPGMHCMGHGKNEG